MKIYNFFKIIVQDWRFNKGNLKGFSIVLLLRIVHAVEQYRIMLPFTYFLKVIYWLYTQLLIGTEFSTSIQIGVPFSFWHCNGTVVNKNVTFGSNCLLRHNTTIGNNGVTDHVPKIMNNVDIGANSVIIGGIVIGNNVKIAAGAIVTKSVKSNSVVVSVNKILSSE